LKDSLETWATSVIFPNNTSISSQLSEDCVKMFESLKNKYPSTFESLLTKLMLFYTKYPHPSHTIHANLIKTIKYKFEYATKNNTKNMLNPSFHNRKIYILPHGGMGDHITMIAAIRVYSVLYDEVIVGVRDKYATNVRQLYADDPTIKIHSFPWPDSKDTCAPVTFLDTFRAQGYEILVPSVCCWGGQVGGKRASSGQIFYRSFYEQCDLNYDNCRWQFSHICRNQNNEESTFNRLNLNNVRYAFVHGDDYVEKMAASQTKLPIIRPSGNMFDLCKVIEQATEIYVMDSSFFCLCVILKLKAIKKVVYVRNSVNVQPYRDPVRGYYNTSVDHWSLIDMEAMRNDTKSIKQKSRLRRSGSSFLQGIIKSKKTTQSHTQQFRSISRSRSKSLTLIRQRPLNHRRRVPLFTRHKRASSSSLFIRNPKTIRRYRVNHYTRQMK